MIRQLLDIVRANQEAIHTAYIEQLRQMGAAFTATPEDALHGSFEAILETQIDYWERDEEARTRAWGETRAHRLAAVGVSPMVIIHGLDLFSRLMRSCLEAHLTQPLTLLVALVQLDESISFLRRCYLEVHFAVSEQRLTRLHELTIAISTERSLEQVLTRTVMAARELAGARYAALGIPDEAGSLEQFIPVGLSDEERKAIQSPPSGRGLLGALLHQAEPIRLRNLAQDPRAIGFPPGHPPMRSFLGVPIRSRDRTIGLLYLTEKEGADEFSADDQRLVEMLAAHAVVAIETDRLYEGIRQRTFELQVLYELSQDIGSTLNYDELVRLMLTHLYRAVPYDVSASLLMMGDRYNLYVRPVRRLLPAVQEDIQERLVQSFGRTHGKAMSPDQTRLDVHRLESRELDTTRPPIESLGSAVQIPLMDNQGHEVVGLLFVGAEQEQAFTDVQVRLLHTMANQVALSIQRLRALLADIQQQRLESLVEHLPEGVLMVDANLRLVLANPVARSYLTVLAASEAEGVLTHVGGYPIEALLQSQPTGNPFREVETIGPPRRIFEVATQPLQVGPDSGGWVLVIREVTEDRQVQERIQQQDRLAAVGQLAAGIAHDFNNLLTGIIGFADMLQRRPDMPEPARARLARIVEQGERGAHLVRQILDFSRSAISQLQPLDLTHFLKEAARFLERTIPENIHVVTDIAPEVYRVRADPTRIQQVLANLAVNARDAMPEGGELRLRLHHLTRKLDQRPPCPGLPVGEWVVLTVSDTGTGIPADVLPRIFEPFFTTKEPGQGTGLGLAQVYGIVQQHEGYIHAESRPGDGTTIAIYLPALAVPQQGPQDAALEEMPHGHGETVLLVEDEPAVLEVGHAILEHLGYRVLTAHNGQHALEVYAAYQGEIALVLMDMIMPEMGGVQLLHALKALNANVKTVMTTGYPLGEEDEQLLPQGIVAWLQKPLNPAQLARAIKRALQK
jgi:signal transduction histidine kinase/ActR/RegA family two-component response regulator